MDAFVRVVREAAARSVADHALAELLGASRDRIEAAVRQTGLADTMASIVVSAVASGKMRADACFQDVPTVMCALGSCIDAQRRGGPVSWERYVEIALDGMRAR